MFLFVCSIATTLQQCLIILQKSLPSHILCKNIDVKTLNYDSTCCFFKDLKHDLCGYFVQRESESTHLIIIFESNKRPEKITLTGASKFAQIHVLILRIIGFLDVFHLPVFWRIENTTFRKLNLFPTSGEGGRHLLSWVASKELTSRLSKGPN
jgi:hypothetical protein